MDAETAQEIIDAIAEGKDVFVNDYDILRAGNGTRCQKFSTLVTIKGTYIYSKRARCSVGSRIFYPLSFVCTIRQCTATN